MYSTIRSSGGHNASGGGTILQYYNVLFSLILLLLLCCGNINCQSSGTSTASAAAAASAFKLDKQTIELLNNGLKALVSIKQILSTIQTFNELSQMVATVVQQQQQQQQQKNNPNLFPSSNYLNNNLLSGQPATTSILTGHYHHHQQPPSPSMASLLSSMPTRPIRMNFMQKLFGKIPTLWLMQNNKSLNNKIVPARDPSIGLIKIGEKPPPGLFPETLPYSVSQFDSTSSSSTSNNNLLNNDNTLKLSSETSDFSINGKSSSSDPSTISSLTKQDKISKIKLTSQPIDGTTATANNPKIINRFFYLNEIDQLIKNLPTKHIGLITI